MATHTSLPSHIVGNSVRYGRTIRSIAVKRRERPIKGVSLRASADVAGPWYDLYEGMLVSSVAQSPTTSVADLAKSLTKTIVEHVTQGAFLDDLMASFPKSNAVCRTDTRYVSDEQVYRLAQTRFKAVSVEGLSLGHLPELIALGYLSVLSGADFVQHSSVPPVVAVDSSYTMFRSVPLDRLVEMELALYLVKDALRSVDLKIPHTWLNTGKLTVVTLQNLVTERIGMLQRAFITFPQKLDAMRSTWRVALAAASLEGGVEDWEEVTQSSVVSLLRSDWALWELSRDTLRGGALAPSAALESIAPHLREPRLNQLGLALTSMQFIKLEPLSAIAPKLAYRHTTNTRGEVASVTELSHLVLTSEPKLVRRFTVFDDYTEVVQADVEQSVYRTIAQPATILGLAEKLHSEITKYHDEGQAVQNVDVLEVTKTPTAELNNARLARALLATNGEVIHYVEPNTEFSATWDGDIFAEFLPSATTTITRDAIVTQRVFFDLTDDDEVELLAALSSTSSEGPSDAAPYELDGQQEWLSELTTSRLYTPRNRVAGVSPLDATDFTIVVNIPQIERDGAQYSNSINLFETTLGSSLLDLEIVRHSGVNNAVITAVNGMVEAIQQADSTASEDKNTGLSASVSAVLLRLMSELITLPAVTLTFDIIKTRLTAFEGTAAERRLLMDRIKHSGLWVEVKFNIALTVLNVVYGIRENTIQTLRTLMDSHQTLRTKVLIDGRVD